MCSIWSNPHLLDKPSSSAWRSGPFRIWSVFFVFCFFFRKVQQLTPFHPKLIGQFSLLWHTTCSPAAQCLPLSLHCLVHPKNLSVSGSPLHLLSSDLPCSQRTSHDVCTTCVHTLQFPVLGAPNSCPHSYKHRKSKKPHCCYTDGSLDAEW